MSSHLLPLNFTVAYCIFENNKENQLQNIQINNDISAALFWTSDEEFVK